MADPILHIKDSYFFEVPKALWRSRCQSLDEVPQFLRNAHPEVTDVAEFNRALDGKVLIPQPFGTPKNFFEPASGFCISRFMVLELVVAVLLVGIFSLAARRVRGGGRPRGVLQNLVEVFVGLLRDKVARPAIGGGHAHHDHHGRHPADRYVPLLCTLFFFILFCNLMGMIPWMGSPTGALGTTVALAGVTFATVIGSGLRQFGPQWLWAGFVPHMELPLILAVLLKPLIFAIEVLGMLIKHGILSVRLLANMVAGHIVLVSIMGMIAAAAGAASWVWGMVAVISVLGCAALSLLELLVAFLQAYIFTFLSALFIGAAVHEH